MTEAQKLALYGGGKAVTEPPGDLFVWPIVTAEDIRYSKDFLKRPAAQTPLKSIAMLKKELGEEAAVCGKVFGPWTLGYHFFGVENWLVNASLDPDMTRECIERMKNITLWFAAAQIEAGADCLLLGDHTTRDLCGPAMYEEFLQPIHTELAEARRSLERYGADVV